ncbi:hypothetical protein E9Y_07981 [Moraxella catarrhalis 101P30B1]|nr:hypothetical protein E9Y_07981 [Moraxella catarrhalis 101P30B1]
MPYFACFAYFTKTKVQKQKWRIHDKMIRLSDHFNSLDKNTVVYQVCLNNSLK